MANIQVPQNPGFPDVYQWDLNDDVIGGPEGIATRPIKQLTERTANLNLRVSDVEEKIESGEIGGGGSAIDYREIYENAPFLFASAKRKITVRAGAYADEDTELDIAAILDTGTLTNGRDYYIYELPQVGSVRTYKVSLSKDGPQGVGPEAERIGGFHTLCADAGSGMTYVYGDETRDHPLNGYLAGDILPGSVWCLNFRPHSEPEGMVYIEPLDIWVDIYLQSGSGFNTKSEYQGAITRSRQYVDFVEDQFCVKKKLLDDAEFACAMLGSNEGTAVQGANDAGATANGAGGRQDTAGRRMLSVYGVEEGCGSLWQWLRSANASGREGNIYQQTTTVPAYGNVAVTTSSYGQYEQSGGGGNFASGKGKIWGICGALLAGGAWPDSTGCGSRARYAADGRSSATSISGGRGRSRTRR